MFGNSAPHTLETRIDALRTRLEAHAPPVLSLYLELGAEPEAPGAPVGRADAALRQLPLARKHREQILKRLRTHLPGAGFHALALFAAEDLGELFELLPLRTLPPLPGGRREVLARWGEPLLAPLRLLLLAERRYLALYLDQVHARLFVLADGEIDECAGAVRPLDHSGWRQLSEGSIGMPGTPARGGSGRDAFRQRERDWTRRFHADLAAMIERELQVRPGAQLLLLGAAGATRQFEELLAAPLRPKIATHHAATADPAAPASAWLPGLAEVVAAAEQARERELVERLERDSVPGLSGTLEALIAGDLAWLALPADSDVVIYRCAQGGWLAADPEGLGRACPEAAYELISLKEVLPDLLERHGTELTLLHGGEAVQVQERFAGAGGGLRRKPAPLV